MLYKSETSRSRVPHVSMRDIKVQSVLSCACRPLGPLLLAPCSSLADGSRCRPLKSSPPTLLDPPGLLPWLQPEAYVSRLVIVPGIITAASRPKHKATYLTVQCKECK